MKFTTSMLGTSIGDQTIQEFEAIISALREENSALKNELVNSKSEINRLTVVNENLDISIKVHQDQSKSNKVEDKMELKKL